MVTKGILAHKFIAPVPKEKISKFSHSGTFFFKDPFPPEHITGSAHWRG